MRKAILLISVLFLIVNCLSAQKAETGGIKSISDFTRDTARVGDLLHMAMESQFKDIKKLYTYSLEARKLSEKINYKHGLGRSLYNIGVYYNNIGQRTQSLEYNKLALKNADPEDHLLKIYLYQGFGIEEGDLSKQLTYLQKAVDEARKINFHKIGFLYHNLGNFYYNRSDYTKAMAVYMKGLRASERFNDSMSMIRNLASIGTVLDYENDEKATLFRRKALALAKETKNIMFTSEIDGDMADYYRRKGNLDSATFYATEGLKLSRDIDHKEGMCKNLAFLADVLRLQNKNDQAIELYLQALDNIEIKNENNLTPVVLVGIGQAYNALHNYKEAIRYLNEAVEVEKELKSKANLITAYQELSKAYYKTSDYKSAYEYFEKYHAINDSTYSLESTKQIASINSKYEVEKKEQAIKLLEKNNHIKDLKIAQSKIQFILIIGLCLFILVITFLLYNRYRIKVKASKVMEEANAEIRTNVKEKEVLLQEIHHRVKNNLQLISSLLKWQGETTMNEEMLKMIGDGRSRIKSMALIHEALYQSNNLAHLNLDQYLNDLLNYLDKAYNRNKTIVLKKTIEPIHLDVDIAIPIGLIVTELVSNCFKYAFRGNDKGQIEVSFIEDEPNAYILRIRDNGLGFPQQVFDDTHDKTMGIQLVKLLVKQVRGTFDIYNDKGANFVISFSDTNFQTHSFKSYGQYQNTNS